MKTPGLTPANRRGLGAAIRFELARVNHPSLRAEELRRVRAIRDGLRALTCEVLIPIEVVDRVQYIADRYGLYAADLIGLGQRVDLTHPLIQGREALLCLVACLLIRRDDQLHTLRRKRTT